MPQTPLPGLSPSEVITLPNAAVTDDYIWENFEFIQNNWVYQGMGGLLSIGSVGAPASTLGNNGDFYLRRDGTSGGTDRIYHKESGSWVAVA